MSSTHMVRPPSSLEENPFAILGASTRDSRQRLIELVEEASLRGDEARIRKAGAELLNPRQRLAAEIRWLPGLPPAQAGHLLQRIRQDAGQAFSGREGSPLVSANLMAAGFEIMDAPAGPAAMLERIQDLAVMAAAIGAAAVLRDINEDRLVSGFPELRDLQAVEDEIRGLRRHHRDCVKQALDRLPSADLLEVMARIARQSAEQGAGEGHELMDALIDVYELEAGGAVDACADEAMQAIDRLEAQVPLGEAPVLEAIAPLEQAVARWHHLAGPILISARARGLGNDGTADLGWQVRGLGIALFNNHGMLQAAERITGLLRQYFAEVPALSEMAEADGKALGEIAQSRSRAAADHAEWLRSIDYRTTLGLLFKEDLAISAAGVEIRGVTIPLEAVTRVCWGAVRHSVNGIPTGTDYTIAVGDAGRELRTSFRKQEVFDAFLDRLWKAVCGRLIFDMLKQLGEGRSFTFGDTVIDDEGVLLTRRRMFAANERRRFRWSEVEIWTANGAFAIGARDEKKFTTALPYLDISNVHLLEHIIRASFRKGGQRLSDALR